MTAKQVMNEKVELPRWVVTTVAPIVVSLLLVLGSYAYFSGGQAQQIKANTEQIAKKVNYQPEFIMVMESLKRIESKLDDHIDKE